MLLPPHYPRPLLLLTGGTGYVGARLLPLLEQQACRLRCLARRPALLRAAVKPTTEIVQGDVLDVASLGPGLAGGAHGLRLGPPDGWLPGFRA